MCSGCLFCFLLVAHAYTRFFFFFFFLMIRRPPRSTLSLPTLFRSQRWVGLFVALALAAQVSFMFWTSGKMKLTWADRKSTRLNSSHTVISYAVFCLKKKN